MLLTFLLVAAHCWGSRAAGIHIEERAAHGLTFEKAQAELYKLKPGQQPATIDDVTAALSNLIKAQPKGYFEATKRLVEQGLASPNLTSDPFGLHGKTSSARNDNPRNPAPAIYPKKSPQDAPYSLSETQLRQQIYIPKSFTYGQKPPVILLPGTGERGGSNFAQNFVKLFQGKPYADVVWLNAPGYQLADAQVNAESIAYAINYISGVSGHRNVSVISWSQGSIDTQWALKYWPSTRRVMSDHVAISPDYHGTEDAYGICTGMPCAPSVFQQEYTSTFIKTLRADGGDSGYIPVTTIYAGIFDEVVEPQQNPIASGYLNDARGVGVSNNEITTVCLGQPAGLFADHESLLYSGFTYALAVDALTHDGPGDPGRLDLATVCAQPVAPGLDVYDVLQVEALIPFALANILNYPHKVSKEPAIMPYAK